MSKARGRRANASAERKVRILRKHCLEDAGDSDVCDLHGIQHGQFYTWQNQLFERCAQVFHRTPGGSNSGAHFLRSPTRAGGCDPSFNRPFGTTGRLRRAGHLKTVLNALRTPSPSPSPVSSTRPSIPPRGVPCP